MTEMPTFYETQRRHAACYCEVLKAIRQDYDRGGDEQADALRQFDILWPQIKQGQAWAVAHAADDAEAAQLCLEYAQNSDMIMSLKGLELEQISWLKQASGVSWDVRIQLDLWAQIGQLHDALGEYDLALLHYDLALEFTERLSLSGQTASTLTMKATTLKNLNRYDEAKAAFDDAIELLKKLGEWPKFTTLHNLANLFARWGKPAKARYTVTRALKLALKEKDRVKEAIVKHTLANIERQLGNLDAALELALAACEINADLGESYRYLQGISLLSEIYERKGMLAEANYWRARAAEGVQDQRYEGSRRGQIRYAEWKSLWRQGRVGEAREVAEAMALDAQQQEDIDAEIQALLKAGANAQTQGDLQRARQNWQRALEAANGADDAFGRAAATGNLGLLLYLEGDVAGAIELYEQGLQLAGTTISHTVELNILGNLGNAYVDAGRQQEARLCYERGLTLAQAMSEVEATAEMNGYIGRLHLLNERYQEAVDALGPAANKLRTTGNHHMAAWFTHLLGVAYWQQGNYTAGLDAMRKALSVFQKIGNQPIADQLVQQIEEMERALATDNPAQLDLRIPNSNEE